MASNNDDSQKRRRRILGAGLRSLGRGAMRSMPGYDKARSWQKTGEDWYDTLGGLKGAAMKMGQIASQYEDLLPPQLIEQLKRLQRNAEPVEFAELEPVLAASWNSQQWARIAEIDPVPMAAASIGQVHGAWLTDGREVVIKVRYPGVAEAIDSDIANLARLLRMSRFMPARGRDLDAVLEELRQRFVEETDYRHELANLQTLRAANLRAFEIPEPILDLCTEGVLVTARLDSAPVERGDPALGEVMIDAINRQVFEIGVLHADPHPGNFGITERGGFALYDFGCVKYLDRDTRRSMRDILAAALVEDWKGVHEGMARLGAVPEKSWEKYADVYRGIYQRHAESAITLLSQRRPYVFIRDDLIEAIRADIRRSMRYINYFKAAPDMVFVMRTLSGLYWILRSMHAEADIYGGLERIVAGEYGPPESSEESSDDSA